MGCDRESQPEYDTNICPRNKDKMQDGRVPDKREEVLMYENFIHCAYDCIYSRFPFS